MIEDPRFAFPVLFVRQNILGALEASKACCVVPGARHLYHITFVARSPEQIAQLSPDDPLDYFLEAQYSPCAEVTWYLHLQEEAGKKQEMPTQEALPEAVAEIDATPKEIIKMWCEHGLVPPTGCVFCYNEDPRNWGVSSHKFKTVLLTKEQMTTFSDAVLGWATATKQLWSRCPTPGCTAGSPETGRICSKLPHTSSGPTSRDFSQDAVTDTIGVTKVLPELSWKGTLGKPPKEFAHAKKTD